MDIVHFFREAGDGFPLILLHGNGESGAYFEHQMGPFARQFHVYAPDTRGHGQTPRGEAPFTIRQFADDLAEFMTERGIDKAHILGFSDGGNIALVFALKYPERVEKLILDGANLNTRGVRRSVQLPIEIGYRMAKRAAERDPKAKRNAEMLGLMVNDPNIPEKALSNVRAETLVIAGTRDMIRGAHTRLIAERIPRSRLCILPGDHFIAAKSPDAFNAAVLDFLSA